MNKEVIEEVEITKFPVQDTFNEEDMSIVIDDDSLEEIKEIDSNEDKNNETEHGE